MGFARRRWKTHRTPDGSVYRLWESPMPRLGDHIVGCSVYLYESENGAKAGHDSGGSGFLVHVPSTANPGVGYLYAVTNKHVLDNGFHVLRLTKKAGGVDTIRTNPQNWFPHPSGLDVKVIPIDVGEAFKWWSVSVDMFISRQIIEVFNIGVGDETFLVGRLVTHGGNQKNAPIARFGNVSLMADPDERIKFKGIGDQEGFLVECRSLSGFSGSPVFVSTSQSYTGDAVQRIFKRNQKGSAEPEGTTKIEVTGFFGGAGPWLLGIDCAHIPLWSPVFEADKQTRTKYWVEANTGIAFVLPAWEIRAILDDRELMRERRKEDKKIGQRLKVERNPILDVAGAGERQFTKSDFESALKKVSRKIKPSGSAPETS
jgi:hypothetical protein